MNWTYIKSMGSDGMHPQVLRELAGSIVGPLLLIFGRLWSSGEVPEDGRKGSVTSVFKKGKKEDLGKYKLVSLTLICGKVMEEINLKTISKQMKDKMRE